MRTYSSDPLTSSGTRIRSLDGLRGWAACVVLLHHLIVYYLGFQAPSLLFDNARLQASWAEGDMFDLALTLVMRFFTSGHVAVCVFFVLSGYVLSFSQRDPSRRTLARATVSRYFRLMFPVLVVSLIAYALMESGLLWNGVAATPPTKATFWLGKWYRFDSSLLDVLMKSLFDVFFKHESPLSYNPSFWTMSWELFGSLLIYAYFGIFKKDDAVQWRVLGGLLCVLVIIKPFLMCFIAGHILYELKCLFDRKPHLQNNRPLNLGCILLFTVAAIVAGFSDRELTDCLIAPFLVFPIVFSSSLSRLFTNKLSDFLGVISFPLYLIQVPIICSWSACLFVELPRLGWAQDTSVYLNLISTLILCILASICLVPIETWTIKWSKKMGTLFLR